ncbi:MAG: SDR family NAD(P)-dependent oxidoreductase [Alphaproteobacteria bacterium]
MIIITGARKGLGLAIANRLYSNGHEVIGISRESFSADFKTYAVDVACFEDLKKIAHELKKQKKSITGLINAAGIAAMNLAITTTEKKTRQIIETNLLGTIFACQVFAPLMMRQAAGHIINFSTIAVMIALKGESIYVAAKSGIEGFSRAFAKEMADFNIQVNCIAPGPIDTDLLKGVPDKNIQSILSHQIIQKQFKPDDIASLVEALLDKKLSSITGEVLSVGGI